MRLGLVPIGSAALSRGIDKFLAEINPLLQSAIDDGVLPPTSTRKSIREECLRAVSGRYYGSTSRENPSQSSTLSSSICSKLSDSEVDDLEKMLQSEGVGYLLSLLFAQDSAYLSSLIAEYRYAQNNLLSTPEYVSRLHRVAERFGANPATLSNLYSTWISSSVISPLSSRSELQSNRTESGRRVFPYLRQITANDDKVRNNHYALHLFTARVDWEGWMLEALAPLGWGCRCLPIRLSWKQAEELGLSGEIMDESSAQKLALFRSLGGADDDFPRVSFVFSPI